MSAQTENIYEKLRFLRKTLARSLFKLRDLKALYKRETGIDYEIDIPDDFNPDCSELEELLDELKSQNALLVKQVEENKRINKSNDSPGMSRDEALDSNRVKGQKIKKLEKDLRDSKNKLKQAREEIKDLKNQKDKGLKTSKGL